MTGIIIAVLLGWAGGYQFYKNKIGMGILYLFTCGLFGIGWIVDIIMAISESNKSNKKDSAMISNVVGTFAECRKNEKVKRKDVINNLPQNCPLFLETAYWEGKPFFLVVDPVSGLDIGTLPKENSAFLKNTYPNASYNVKLMEKDLDKPVIEINIIGGKS